MTDRNLASDLSKDIFNPELYVHDLALKVSGVEELLQARQKVQTLAEETNGLLKKNVYNNYTQFIETAKEISYLESEMYQLSHMLTEQQTVLSSLLEISVSGERALSISECQLQQKDEEGRKNLSSLLEKVEGCASIFEIQGRCMVHSGELVEVDRSDHRPLQRVFVVLLNDSLMLANWIPNRTGPVQYKFQGLYELDNVAVADVTNSLHLKNEFRILVFPEERIFQCDSVMSKNEWVSAIEAAKKQKTYAHLREPLSHIRYADAYEDEGIDETEQEVPEWIVELPEDLDVCIAQRNFEEAVDLVEKAQEHFAIHSKNAILKEIRPRIDSRIKHLVEVLMKELRGSPDRSLQGGPRAARRAVLLLIKLGKSSEACALFLHHRSSILKQSMRQQKMEGQTTLYVKRLCAVFFNNMVDTGREFQRAFDGKNSCVSAFVVWAKSELLHFIQKFSRHVFTPQVTLAIAAECVQMLRQNCDQLMDIGMDLSFVLEKQIGSDVEHIIAESRDKMLEAVKLRVAEDKWRPQNFQNKANLNKFLDDMTEVGIASIHSYMYDECWIGLTSCTTSFSKSYLNFIDDLLKLHMPSTRSLITQALTVTFQAQLRHLEASIKNKNYKDEVKFIQRNAKFLLETLLTLAEHRYEEKVGHPCMPLCSLHSELQRIISSAPSCDGDSTAAPLTVTKYSTTDFL